MRIAGGVIVLKILFVVFLLVQAGCEQMPVSAGSSSKFDFSVYAAYAPAKIDILPLTEFISLKDVQEDSGLNVYVSLLDSFGSGKKSPGVFRFELYNYIQHSAEPKGKRVVIWPDIDLTDLTENNEYWRDFLRAYEFNLPFELAVDRSHILQVTFLCPNAKRLSDEFLLKPIQ